MPQEAVMGLATVFATADVMDPRQEIETLKDALALLSTYMDEQPNVAHALSWLTGVTLSACELAAMGLRMGAKANGVELGDWIQHVAQVMYSSVPDGGDLT